jgi:hypothetical protein
MLPVMIKVSGEASGIVHDKDGSSRIETSRKNECTHCLESTPTGLFHASCGRWHFDYGCPNTAEHPA